MKRRQAKRQKDATLKDDKLRVLNGVFSHGVFFFCIFALKFRLFAWRVLSFCLSPGVFTSFRLVSFRGVFSPSVFSHGVFSRGVFSRQKDEMVQNGHHPYPYWLTRNSLQHIIIKHSNTIEIIIQYNANGLQKKVIRLVFIYMPFCNNINCEQQLFESTFCDEYYEINGKEIDLNVYTDQPQPLVLMH